ncbi:hypothetical protein K0M31_017693 [Melipona bicolor]|uniref:Uncharacterized protein n=1 Tax=Melipona bicolor TaxID=60889 RepID=A0AA40G5T7_9HYME|nr:hypothetical protein K0M31_017693 [Melipona bicolor]
MAGRTSGSIGQSHNRIAPSERNGHRKPIDASQSRDARRTAPRENGWISKDGDVARFHPKGHQVNFAGRYINSKLVSSERRFDGDGTAKDARITDPQNTQLSSIVITEAGRGLADLYLYTRHAATRVTRPDTSSAVPQRAFNACPSTEPLAPDGVPSLDQRPRVCKSLRL